MTATNDSMPVLRAREYQYSPLSGRNQASSICAGSQLVGAHDNANIRLLTLHPGREDAEIQFSLDAVPLLSEPSYEAISYVWGDQTVKSPIFCSGKLLHVTRNLHSALKCFRLSDRDRTLWADAICINQGDLCERSSQVMIMKDIYSQAQQVLIWLGEEKNEDKGVLDDIGRLYEVFQGIPRCQSTSIRSSPGNDQWFSLMKTIADTMDGRMEAFGRLLEYQWFRRVWVVQEVACAKNAVLHHGTRSLKWDKFSSVAEELLGYQLVPVWTSPYPEQTLRHVHGTIGSPKRTSVDLFDLLSLARNYTCSTEPRDKIYALLGLASKSPQAPFRPDYSKDTREAFIDFTASQLRQGFLKYLNATSYLKKDDNSLHLPSWVPDWTRPDDRRSFETFPIKHFKASRDSSPKLRIDSEANVLSIEGFICGRIQDVAPKTPAEYPDDNLGLLSFFLACHRFVFGPRKKITEEFQRSKFYFAFLGVCSCEIRLPHPPKVIAMDHVPRTVRESFLRVDNTTKNEGPSSAEDRNAGTSLVLGLKEFKEPILEFSEHRRLFSLSRQGHRFIGWAAGSVMAGDLVCIFKGANVPHVIRDNNNDSFQLLGECYLQDHMRGGAMGMGLEERSFHIS